MAPRAGRRSGAETRGRERPPAGSAEPRPDPRARLDAWLGAALVLPVLVVAWPGSGSLADDPNPLLTSAGLVLPALLPAAVLFALRGAPRACRAPLLLALPVASALLALAVGRVTDTREAWRAALLGASALIALGAGCSLGGAGRAVLARGLTLASLLLLVTAFVASPGLEFVGVLGNTGTLSQVALPGAVVGGWLAITGRGPWRVLGALAVLLFIAHAGTGPVLAGALALTAAMCASALLSPWARRRRAIKRAFGLLAALCLFALIAARRGPVAAAGAETAGAGPAAAGEVAQRDAAGEDRASAAGRGAEGAEPGSGDDEPRLLQRLLGGGLEVRARVWARLPRLWTEHPLLGVGPGQFVAGFPPCRDPAEIELSTHGRASGAETLVEHPHNDWLYGAVEWGAAGGLAWILFLLVAGGAAVRGTTSRDLSLAPLAAASIAVLVGALFHSPLLYNPAAAAAAFAVLGCTLSAVGRDAAAPAAASPGTPGTPAAPAADEPRTRLPALLALGVLLALTPQAFATVRHGRALTAALEDLDRPLPAADAPLALAMAGAELDAALEACPDSVRAHALLARLQAARGESDAALESWAAVLTRRPHDLEALQQTAVIHARAGRIAEARAAWEHARALDPEHPLVLRNLAQLELNAGRPEVALGLYRELRAAGRLDAEAARGAAGQELLAGHQEAGLLLLDELAELRLHGRPSTPEELWAEAAAQRERRHERWADALACAAQRAWAWEHAAAEDPDAAVRSLRQALSLSARHVPGGAGEIRWELAAALSLANREGEARELAAELDPPSPDTLRHVAEWARVELESASLAR